MPGPECWAHSAAPEYPTGSDEEGIKRILAKLLAKYIITVWMDSDESQEVINGCSSTAESTTIKMVISVILPERTLKMTKTENLLDTELVF